MSSTESAIEKSKRLEGTLMYMEKRLRGVGLYNLADVISKELERDDNDEK